LAKFGKLLRSTA